ncbi:MAG TPA: ABC transporter ATP-binding protein [Candidatus Sulfotelmatobacter sp.]|nr:ABC transporter ATP-binding protein [Candidatus Sulfotelmatobacter sp.]
MPPTADRRPPTADTGRNGGPVIEVRDLVVQRGDRRILDGVSFTVQRGETTVILGGSGCGKSTLLRHMVGLDRPLAGRVLLWGQDITELPEAEVNGLRRKMGILFQSGALFNSMTVGENVAVPLREHTELPDSTIEIMVRMKLGLVGLSGFEDYMPAALSGGMKKRAGLARAMAMDPEILFFDEPSAGLDPITAAGLDELILRLRQTFQMTIVVVTHELPSLFLIAEKVVMLDKGKVVLAGTLGELRASADPRVQQFLERRPAPEMEDEDEMLRILTR